MLGKLRYKWNIRGGRRWYKHVERHVGFNSILLPSLEELLQLDRFHEQKYLLHLLYYGKEHPNYDEILLQVSMKYAHIGSLSYYMPGRGCRKPPMDIYTHILVEGCYETVDEVKDHMTYDLKKNISYEESQVVFNKFMYAMKLMIPFMACPREAYWAYYYKKIIEYVIDMNVSEVPICKSMWGIFPIRPKREAGEYDNLPDDLDLQGGNTDYGNIWE